MMSRRLDATAANPIVELFRKEAEGLSDDWTAMIVAIANLPPTAGKRKLASAVRELLRKAGTIDEKRCVVLPNYDVFDEERYFEHSK